jgi:hypothetical protein
LGELSGTEKSIPNISLEDKTILEGEALSAQQCVNSVELGLVTVAESFDLVKAEKRGKC